MSYSQAIFGPKQTFINYITTDSVEVGHPILNWNKPSFDQQHDVITGFKIVRFYADNLNPEGIWQYVADVDSSIRSYKDLNASFNTKRLTYAIISEGKDFPNSSTGPQHSNIFITSKYDSCNNQLRLEWKAYEGWGNGQLEKYDIYMGFNNIPNTYTKYGSVKWFKTDTIVKVQQNSDYYFYITAKKTGEPYKTYSNLYHRKTTMPKHPSSIKIDSILGGDKKVELFFKIDTATMLKNFQVVRWEFPDSIKKSSTLKPIYTFSDKTLNYYADEMDSWASRTRPFYYKIDALNSCSTVVKVSNHGNSITLRVHAENGMKNSMSWDSLWVDKNLNDLVTYRVIRYAYTNAALPPVYITQTDKIEFIDNVKQFEGQGYSIRFCYQIEAIERNTLLETTMLSRSRIQCVDIIPGVRMPEAIMPNDTKFPGVRNILAPTITFLSTYSLSVYNRWGSLVFNAENKGWNGYLPNGELAKEGTYIYRLIVRIIGNKDVIKEGSFVVVYK